MRSPNMYHAIGAVICMVFILLSIHIVSNLSKSSTNWLLHESCSNMTEHIRYKYRAKLVNAPFTESDVILNEAFQHLVTSQAEPDDPDLIRVAKEVIEAPSSHPYKVHSTPITPQLKEVIEILHKKRGGFFIECGGYDGEISSNTLYLERELGWHGLLVEMDFRMYSMMLAKSRHALTVNACLSTTRHPMMMEITDSEIGGGRIMPEHNYTHLHQVFGARLGEKAPCFPLDTLLLALNVKHVDYFSLDVEGYELDVLRTIDWNTFVIDVISVEYKLIAEGKQACRDYMESVGYVTFDDIHYSDGKRQIHVFDYIFVRKDVLQRSGLSVKSSSLVYSV